MENVQNNCFISFYHLSVKLEILIHSSYCDEIAVIHILVIISYKHNLVI